MRLLYTKTTEALRIEEFSQDRTPTYAILSHRWEEEEVTLQDIRSQTYAGKKGFPKLKGCCKRAAADGYDWVWIDTCCIDKASSAELSEAINSMYRWYQGADVCYAYLSDVHDGAEISSKWFSRGWTLQELIAPRLVILFNAQWEQLGTKHSFADQISSITLIPVDVLRGKSPFHCNAAQKMSWASMRETSREEDMAYSLMGIFDVNMPAIYGEGSQKAFLRLQEKIIRQSSDQTLFLWTPSHEPYNQGLLATSPKAFCSHQKCFHWLSALVPESMYDTKLDYGVFSPVTRTSSSTLLNHHDTLVNGTVTPIDPAAFSAQGLHISLLCAEGVQVSGTADGVTIVLLDIIARKNYYSTSVYLFLTADNQMDIATSFVQDRLGAMRRQVSTDPRSNPWMNKEGCEITLSRKRISVSQVRGVGPGRPAKFVFAKKNDSINPECVELFDDEEETEVVYNVTEAFTTAGAVAVIVNKYLGRDESDEEKFGLVFGTHGRRSDPWCALVPVRSVNDPSTYALYSEMHQLSSRFHERASQEMNFGRHLCADIQLDMEADLYSIHVYRAVI